MDPDQALRDLTELHRSGVVSDAEFERLRSRLPG
jgi:Short C-terminal domain